MAKSYAVKYVNHAGAEYVLQGNGLSYVDVLPLFSFQWSYTLSNKVNRMGGIAGNFARYPRTVELELRMRGFSREQFLARMNELHAVTDADNIAEQPGRLYLGDQYMVCFLAAAADTPKAPHNGNFAVQPVTVLAVEPYWRTEKTYTFNPDTSSGDVDTTGKKYNGRYPYRYGSGLSTYTLINTHYAECPAIITIYGPCSDPSVTIGGNLYNVPVVLTANQRLVIDGVNNKIYTVGSNGEITSIFDQRNKSADNFRKIPIGESAVLYSGEFLMTVTMVEQRSQPKWTV